VTSGGGGGKKKTNPGTFTVKTLCQGGFDEKGGGTGSVLAQNSAESRDFHRATQTGIAGTGGKGTSLEKARRERRSKTEGGF